MDHPAGPSITPVARYNIAVLNGRRFSNDPDKAIVINRVPIIIAQIANVICQGYTYNQ